MNIIPAIDLKDGKCVRLYQGDFEQVTEYNDNPVEVARKYASLESTDLHIVDLDGARSGAQAHRSLIRAIVDSTGMSIQLGGGLRDRPAVEGWFESGVARCVIGSLAVTDPDTVNSWLRAFGPDRIVLALDVLLDSTGQALLTTHGWTRPSQILLQECIAGFVDAGLKHVLCTDVSRDGAMSGPNLSLYAGILERFPGLVLQASGGVRHIDDIRRLDELGVPAVITGRALLEGRIQPAEVVAFRQNG